VATSGAGRAAGAPSAGASVEQLWLATLQRLAAGVAHELRNALNGVAVNLEVVRSRSARDGTPATSLAQYAGSASEQLEGVIAIAEALVSLNREPQRPLAAARVADQVLALLRPPLVASGGSARLVVVGEGRTNAPPDVARIVLAAALDAAAGAAAEGRTELLCVVRPASGIEVEITAGAAPLPLDASVCRLAADHGIGIDAGRGIRLSFQ
jgi:signal transduction histidine kinase